jgi:glycosyltransferase involved in cell wall biosynthesis
VKVVALPDAPEDEKNLALLSCDAVILPVTNGGGTNLKTAEALLSGKPVIATKVAFRGYERCLSAPEVFIDDDAREFYHHMVQIASRTTKDGNLHLVRRPQDVEGLSWDAILEAADEHIREALLEQERV